MKLKKVEKEKMLQLCALLVLAFEKCIDKISGY
jgi:hypothetical protein